MASLDPTSDESRALADEVVAGFLRQWPTEYMALEQLWHVDMSGDVVMIQGMVTDEEADVLVAIRAQHGLEITARVTSHSAVTNRSELMAEIAGLYPGVPASMLACADFDEFLAAVQ